MSIEKPGESISIFTASQTHTGEQGAAVRPTLDHLVELTCKRIVSLGRRGVLPVKAVQR
jgi:hypothetical protein